MGIQATAQVFADKRQVMGGVLGQVAFYLVTEAVGEVEEIADEVFTSLQLETAK